MKNIENIIVILLACIVILINGQYVAEDKGGLMRYIPTYDKAGNKMGDHWWHPIYKLDQTPPPWQPWQKTLQTEFTDNRFNPEGLGIENFAHDALQTWPTPILQHICLQDMECMVRTCHILESFCHKLTLAALYILKN